MKDRVNRSYKKKPKHLLKRSMIVIVLFTAVFSASMIAVMSHYSQINSQISRRIDNYQNEINYLEEKYGEVVNKHPKKNP